jgi:ribosomal protein S18 acetylase RimI-like enzyme
MGIVIKPIEFCSVSKHDMNYLLKIELQAFKQSHWSAEHFEMKLPHKNLLSFVAYSGETIVGFIAGSSYYLNNCLTSHINRIAINEDYRGQGVGKRLLLHFENASKILDISNCTLESENKESVKAFYLRSGYEIVTSKRKIINYLFSKKKLHRKLEFLQGDLLFYMKKL